MQQKMYKLNDGLAVEYNGESIVLAGMRYSNPTEGMLMEAGYRPMGNVSLPEYDMDTEKPEIDHYIMNDDGTMILPVYIVVEWKEPEAGEVELTVEQRVAALEQAGLERDMALMELAAMLAGGDT